MANPNLFAMATVNAKTIVATPSTTAATTAYTVTTGKAVMIAKANLVNLTTGVVVVTINLVPSGSAVATSNRIVSALSTSAGSTSTLAQLDGVFLAEGDYLSMTVATASGASLSLSVLEIS